MNISDATSLIVNNFHNNLIPGALNVAITLSPILLAIILFPIMWQLWKDYIHVKFFLSLKYTVLELKLPQETLKSPLAMETVLQSIHNTSDGSFISMYWKGEVRPWYSLELVSLGGQVKFMLWTEDRRKVNLMSVLYAQFPGIEIYEREDYTKSVHFDPKKMRIWAQEFVFTKDDPYPIKTYVDFGLDKDPKEEFKVDPIVNVIEFLGSVPVDSQIWMQIMVRAHKKEAKKPGHLLRFADAKTDPFMDKGDEIINKLMVRNQLVGKSMGKGPDAKITKEAKVAGAVLNEGGFIGGPAVSKGEEDAIVAIERKRKKLLFDVGFRTLYISPKDKFDGPFGIGGSISSWRQYSWEGFNGFKPGDKWHGLLKGNPWEDYRNTRRDRYARLALMAYKRRSFFYYPFEGKPIVLNTEELATIYHFPGSVAASPALQRVPSKKVTPPSNLPV